MVGLSLSAAPFSAVVPDATGVELFFVARTASGSTHVRASARHCHRPLRPSSVASLSPLKRSHKNLPIFVFDGWTVGHFLRPGGAPGNRAR